QHPDVRRLGEQLLDLRRCRLRHGEQRSGGRKLLDLGHRSHRSNVLRGPRNGDFVTLDARLTMRFLSIFVRSPGRRLEMLDNWLPFLFYGSFAVLIPASMVLMSFAFAQRPARRLRARTIPFES